MSKKRLDHDGRINIQAGIAKGYSLRKIAETLGKSRSTIYREIINNCYYRDCRHTCSHCELDCEDKASHYKNGQCQAFIAHECERWKGFPYTCNGCSEPRFCSHRKRYYDCVEAHAASKRKRAEPRTFKGLSEGDLAEIDSIVTGGVENGQSIHHVYVNSPALRKKCCERTIRRYVYRGYLSVKSHQLPRYARYSHKYDYEKRKVINVARMLGRTFSDYKKHVRGIPATMCGNTIPSKGRPATRRPSSPSPIRSSGSSSAI